MMAKTTAIKKSAPVAAARKTSTAVAPAKRTAVAAAAPQRKRGMEEADSSAFAIPFLRILQKMSPALDEIKGSKAGMILNTATGELLTSIELIPVLYNRRFIHWGNRNVAGGGGFKGQVMPSEAVALEEKGVVKKDDEGVRLYYPLPDGSINEKKCDILSDTRTHYVLYRGKSGNWEPAVIAMASTQIKKSKQWMSKMASAPGESTWELSYKATTLEEKNDKGSWFAWAIVDGDEVPEDIQAQAEQFAVSVDAGAAKANFEHSQDGVGE